MPTRLCDRCGQLIEEGALRYIAKIQVYAAYDPLNVDFAELKKGAQSYLLPGLGIGGLLALELILVVAAHWRFASHALKGAATPAGTTNTAALGHILYTDYVYYFEVAGLILLVAMIGAIVLTLRHREGVRRQKAWTQISREPADAMAMVDAKPGEGVE